MKQGFVTPVRNTASSLKPEWTMLKSWLAHPLTRGLSLDDPHTTHLRRRILAHKPFLRDIYHEWYAQIAAAVPPGPGPVVELGSGAGFLSEYIPNLMTSDVFVIPGLNLVLDGHRLPFASGALRGLVMTNVMHHFARPRAFMAEAARCLRPGGMLIMIEPWVSRWSRFIYRNFHYEPFEPTASLWELPPGGPLSTANNALPWIMFERDRAQMEHEFPQWRVVAIRPLMPFRYLLSGGMAWRSLMPGWATGFWRGVEACLQPMMRHWAMFALIQLMRNDRQP